MLNDVFSVLASTPEALRRALAHFSPEEVRRRPAPSKWSVQIILAHLSDLEEFYMRERVEAMLERDKPVLVPFDQEVRALERGYDQTDPRRTLAAFTRQRQSNLRRLRRLRPAQLKRAGTHPAIGEVSLEELLTEWAFHDLGHLRQIMEVKRYAFYPRIGSMRAFYKLS